jgi:ribosomal protein S18 acetylase RimI-like enzyme
MIETGSYPEKDDKLWKYFTAYEIDDGYHFAGVISFYEFFKEIGSKRARISQQVILPQYQRMGLGYHMLEVCIYLILLRNFMRSTSMIPSVLK